MRPKTELASNWSPIEAQLETLSGQPVKITQQTNVSGGCINQCWQLADSSGKKWFVKQNNAHLQGMFVAEAAALEEIIQTRSIRAPQPVCHTVDDQYAYLVLEYIPMQGGINSTRTGEQLARMHQHTNDFFGWDRDNTIGATPQPNRKNKDWSSFWRQQRLEFQLDLALQKGYPGRDYDAGMKLAEKLGDFFSDYQPLASLLHGDLWGGNCASDQNGQPVIYDPATYYGDRECDIAMTELFGGFGQRFYSAYNAAFPLDSGYRTRKQLYNLYHILNHYNLFGGSYGAQAASMTQQLLAHTG